MGILDRIQERREARAEVEREVTAFMKKNPDATQREVTRAMKKKWGEKYGASPQWLILLLQILPLILKIFNIQ